jgi:hypothetical protein
MLLQKVFIYTHKFYLFIVTSFFCVIIYSFSVLVENCILLPKDMNDSLCSCVLYMYGFDFLSFYPDIYLMRSLFKINPKTANNKNN